MRIESRPVSANAPTGSLARAPGTGARFALPSLYEAPQSVASAGVSSLGGLDAMIALQANESATERRKRAAKRGHALLDELESLKIAVLSGRVGPAQLRRLMAGLKEERHAGSDPRLDEVISHIELRASVELAKMGIRDA